MAPCSTNYSSIHHIRISERDNIKGYSHCRRDSVHFLSAGSNTETSVTPQQQEKKHLHQAQRASSSSPVCSSLRPTMLQNSSSNSSRGPVWRPW
ncbi:hypothetical protein D9C73_011459 [Collichthys lucidus]|uniref:Uncharacterized protein n=1 Tax=Collichthys lucidus TaxID=240159 RepID=A0A4U5URU4_COLLU|nr:hypothetical protein D9C73_011459 [Collichthys lucidus]